MEQVLYTGVVEDRNDPLKLGRCRVRVIGLHEPLLAGLSTEMLPWFIPLSSVNSASVTGIGQSPTGLIEGSNVIVTFLDQDTKQQGIILGSIAGIPTVHSSDTGEIRDSNVVAANVQAVDTTSPNKADQPVKYKNEVSSNELFLGSLTKADFDKFSNVIGQRESGNKYSAENTLGFLGKYQFGAAFLYDTGYIKAIYPKNLATVSDDNNWTGKNGCTSKAAFKTNSSVQEELFEIMCRRNHRILGLSASTPKNRTSGLLAAAHLKGAGAVKKWMNGSLANTKDAYGTDIQTYYDLGFKIFGDIPPKEQPTDENVNTPEESISDTDRKKGNVPQEKKNPIHEQIYGFRDPSNKYPLKKLLNQPDTNRLARAQNLKETIITDKTDLRKKGCVIGNSNNGKTWSQPEVPYGSVYPFNHVIESESGHIVEIDDTPNAERLHVYHRTGTFFEIDANGTQVNRIVGNGYTIIDNDGYVSIIGQCVVNIEGDATVSVGGSMHATVANDINVAADGNISVASKKKITMVAESDIQLSCKNFVLNNESFNMNTKGRVDVLAGSTVNIDGKHFYSQSKTAAPIEMDDTTFSKFNADNLVSLPAIPSREMTELFGLEEHEDFDKKAQGYDPRSPELAKTPAIDKSVSTNQGTPMTNVEPVKQEEADTLGNEYRLSTNYYVKNLMFASSGGKVTAQHNLTAKQIVENMRKVACNILEPLLAKYGKTMILTSGFRVKGNAHSLPAGRVSQHELGLAVDMQFTDCKNHNDYAARVKEISSLASFGFILLENIGGKIWIHIDMRGK